MADTPLAQLDPDAQQALAELGDALAALDSDERQAVAELAQARADGKVSRREFGKALATLGVGAVVGGGSAAALTGDAEANDTGTAVLGEPGNPADVHLDRVLDDGGDLVADLDDTGDLVFQNRGISGLSEIDTGQINTIPQATTETELSDALTNVGAARLRGVVSLSSSVTVPDGAIVYGHGVYRQPSDTIFGDGLRGDFSGPLLNGQSANAPHFIGFAARNDNANGDCIGVKGTARVRMCDLSAGRYAINGNVGGQNDVEPIVTNNRMTGIDGTNGSIGIYLPDQADSHVIDNIVRGFEEGIHVPRGSTRIFSNHVYQTPRSNSIQRGVTVGAESKIRDNYISGGATEYGLQVNGNQVRVKDNTIQVVDSVGIEFTPTTWGRNEVHGNNIENFGSGSADTLLAPNVTTWNGKGGQARANFGPGETRTSVYQDTLTKSGDGSKTFWSVTTDLIFKNDASQMAATFTPRTADARAAAPISLTNQAADDVAIAFDSAPASGTDNVVVDYEIKLIGDSF